MEVSGKMSKISSVIAAVCILIYVAAIAFGAVRIIDNAGERGEKAAEEFNDLADRASSSAVFLGFMSDAYQESIRDFLANSETLEAVIISGSNGEYAFEKYSGNGIAWMGSSPRFKAGAGFFGEPFYLPLRIEGQRNGTIQAVYGHIDRDFFLETLRNTLFAVLVALTAAFITLIAELALKKRNAESRAASSGGDYFVLDGETVEEDGKPAADKGETGFAAERDPETPPRNVTFFQDEPEDTPLPFEEISFEDEDESGEPPGAVDLPEEDDASGEEAARELFIDDGQNAASTEHPRGLFTPRGNVGWESYTRDRLASELHRCASFEQDLIFLNMEFGESEIPGDSLYRLFTDEAVSFFTMRDLIFEKGEKGISVIVPSVDLEQGMAKSEEFLRRVSAKLPESFAGRNRLCIGLSSRSGRLIEAERLMLEAATALQKALADPVSPVVAFKSDPDKYREFINKPDR